jgi:hypothetical protein
MGWAGFSIAAIRLLEQSSLNNEGLINTCVKWDVTHDIGLGIYTWMHSIQVIDIRLGDYNGFKELNQYRKEDVHWHKPFGNGMKVDVLFDLILKCGDVNAEFDLKKYLDCERELGKQYNAQHNRLVPYGVFKNTMFYRRMAYYKEIAAQVQESQRTAKLNLDVTDYVPNMCTEDKMLFEGWEATRSWSKEKHNTHGLINGQPQECLEYTEYIHNLPVNITEADLPPLDDLIRKRRG